MKREVYLVILLIFICVVPPLVLGAERVDGVVGIGGERLQSIDAQSQLEQNFENALANPAQVLDFNQPIYKNNKDLVRKVLREKYNIDLASITGGPAHAPSSVEVRN